MQFKVVDLGSTTYLISATGPIVNGDDSRLLAAIVSMPAVGTFYGFGLDSPGGNVFEAEKMAITISRSGGSTIVGAGDKCVSACFLLFAASNKRSVATDALVGVHSVSVDGHETSDTLGLTTAFARDVSAYGVPPAIIGKLVSTKPGSVEWLTPDDLRSMGAYIFVPASAAQPAAEAQTTLAPSVATSEGGRASAISGEPGNSLAFQQGLNDRRNYETWFDALTGDYQAGAFYWSGQRSLKIPGHCVVGSATFKSGCLAAENLLHPSDLRRYNEPVYRAGWNSL